MNTEHQNPAAAPAPAGGDGADDSANLLAVSIANADDAFPVLMAFQKFLDSERERARKRQQTLVYCFSGILLAVVLLFVAGGAILFGAMSQRDEIRQNKFLDMIAERNAAGPDGVKRSGEFDALAKEVSEAVALLTRDMGAMKDALAKQAAASQAAAKAAAAAAGEPAKKPPAAATAGAAGAPRSAQPQSQPQARQPAASSAAASRGAPTQPPPRPSAAAPAPAAPPAPVEIVPATIRLANVPAMKTPPGHAAAETIIVTPGDAKYPWRILLPDDARGAAEAAK